MALQVSAEPHMDLLRFSTAGSVDDGKSTLIGRLLYESKAIFEDQLQAVERASHDQGADYVNLALLTDGLRAEREQGITIDVAYRYFATPKRKFIIADTPGHAQYTRNMVTGASTVDLAVVLADASRGLTEQSRRHLFIASLLRIPRVVICINKMDLVDYAEDAFHALHRELTPFVEGLALADVTFVPVSALRGDNVVEHSDQMPWYEGPSLLDYLETVPLASAGQSVGGRFPIQWVVRPHTSEHRDYRGYAGQVVGGALRPGDEVVVLPSGVRTRIAGIDTFDGPVEEAVAPLSVVVRLADDVDASRGDLIASADEPPLVGRDLDVTLCWLAARPLRPGDRFALKHTTRDARAVVTELHHRVDVNTLERDESVQSLGLNDIGRARVRVATPLAYDPYADNRATGGFILIDETTNETVGAGIIEGAAL